MCFKQLMPHTVMQDSFAMKAAEVSILSLTTLIVTPDRFSMEELKFLNSFDRTAAFFQACHITTS